MSKLNGYSDEDRNLVVVFMQEFVRAKMARGELPQRDKDVKAEMPKTFEPAKMFVDTMNNQLARYANIDSSDLARMRALAAQLFQGSIRSGEITHDMEIAQVEKLSKELVHGSVQTVNAVAEYLCG